jgi:hypothetical protein
VTVGHWTSVAVGAGLVAVGAGGSCVGKLVVVGEIVAVTVGMIVGGAVFVIVGLAVTVGVVIGVGSDGRLHRPQISAAVMSIKIGNMIVKQRLQLIPPSYSWRYAPFLIHRGLAWQTGHGSKPFH